MSRIDDLLADFCPDGVPFLPLGELLDYQQPSKYLVDSKNYDDSFATPVLTAGQTFILGYTDETSGIYPASPESPVVIFDDFTASFKWVDFPFKAKSSAMKMLTPKANLSIDFRFIYFAMLCIRFTPQDHARQWISKYSTFRIPVPPIEVQREIAGILSQFTDLEVELEAELKARRRQQEHYRHLLFDGYNSSGVRRVRLADVGTWYGGGTPSKSRPDYWTGGKIPWISPKDMGRAIVDSTEDYITATAVAESSTKQVPADAVAIVVRSSILDHTLPIAFIPVPAALNQDMKAVIARDGILPKYLFHAFRAFRATLLRDVRRSGGSVASLDSRKLWDFEIPVPDVGEQSRAVQAMDKFDGLVEGISAGIPAELAARRQQYEHYRDKLLTFKERVP